MTFLIVRGDLRSHTGYSKALRGIVSLAAPFFDRVCGVDLHYSPAKSTVPFPYPILEPHQIGQLWRDGNHRITVLHFTSPDGFVPYANTHNIGYFFWECDRFRPDLFWADAIRGMDEMWVPNQFMAGLVGAQNFGGPIRVISWPHDFSAPAAPGDDRVDLELMASAEVTKGKLKARLAIRPLSSLRDEFSPIFLGIMTDVARKGLPILFSEWCEYLAARKKRSLLLLKLSSINVSKTIEQLREDVLNQLAPLCGNSAGKLDIAFVFGSLSEQQLAALYRVSDVYVSSTLGEGFGGPLIECVLNQTPYIAPRHTSLAELIPPDYAFILESEAASIILRDNLPVYSPSSIWHIVCRGAIAAALQRYEGITPRERHTLLEQARSYPMRLCDKEAVREAIAAACAQRLGSADCGSQAEIV